METVEDKYLPFIRTMSAPNKKGYSMVDGLGVQLVVPYGEVFTACHEKIGVWTRRQVYEKNLYTIVHACLAVGKPKMDRKGNFIEQKYQFYRVVSKKEFTI